MLLSFTYLAKRLAEWPLPPSESRIICVGFLALISVRIPSNYSALMSPVKITISLLAHSNVTSEKAGFNVNSASNIIKINRKIILNSKFFAHNSIKCRTYQF